jgi:beta-galactosidase
LGKLPIIPRIGFVASIAASHEFWKWYGLGPHENYEDRRVSAWTAIHEGRVSNLFHCYLDPQEAGIRTEIRWATLSPNSDGVGLRIDSLGEPFDMAVLPCLPIDLELGRHAVDLPQRDRLTLRIDHRSTGLGGTNSWGQWPLPQYRLEPTGQYEWSFRLAPFLP